MRPASWVLLAVLAFVVFVWYRQASRPDSVPSEAAPVVVASDGRSAPIPPQKRAPVVDEQVSIKEDSYYSQIVELNRDATVSVSVDVLFGPAIETFVLDAAGFQQFEKAGKSFFGGEYTHFPAFKMVDARQERRSARLPQGRYYFVLDNTDVGSTKPPANLQEDTVEVRVIISAE